MQIFYNVISLLSRYFHIVAATLLVGGTLFFEMVVPIAIDDLRQETQLAVFARARWVFRWIVWLAVGLILLSGIISTQRQWKNYDKAELAHLREMVRVGEGNAQLPLAMRPGWWWAAHAGAGVAAVLIALSLTLGGRPPSYPLWWMRIDMVILLIVIFLGSTTRMVALAALERADSTSSTRPVATMAD